MDKMLLKSLSYRLCMLLSLLLLSQMVKAYDVEVDGIYYNVDTYNRTAEVTKKSGSFYSGSIVIPNMITVNGIRCNVTSIGNDAFFYSNLISITIPVSITSIGNNAFMGCSSLASIIIPSNVTSIGYYAFASCSGLTSIRVDPNNQKYDSRGQCNAIIETNTNTLIAGCKLSVIPQSVITIGQAAFYGCGSMTSINIPNSVTRIGDYAFAGCSDLESLVIPRSVTFISEGSFSGCSGLASITVESNNPKYDSREGCNAIIETSSNNLIAGCRQTIIPRDVVSIGKEAFQGCRDLTSITLPNSVTSIGNSAFFGCI